jgi:hypothetical protein
MRVFLAVIIGAAALAVMLTTGISTQALAQQTHMTTVAGFYNTSCGTWTQARANHQSVDMEYWLRGFVSRVNMIMSEWAPDFLKASDSDALFGWIDNYCHSKPLDLIPTAAMNLIIELRARTPPQ